MRPSGQDNAIHNSRLGTFFGVFLPCLLTILGVILFVRLGWVAGNLGLIQTWILVTLATSITFITGLSVAALATNMHVGGGGSYYMISRALGLEAGAAIGLPLFFGKALGVSFYIVGFAESLQFFYPDASLAAIASVVLLILTALAVISADLAARSQLLVFIMITVSLAALAFGGAVDNPSGDSIPAIEPVGFWVAFAIFFPAVTGIEAGVGLSGDLKNPRFSLQVGVITAIATSYVIYMAVPWLMLKWVSPELLRSDPLIMREVVPHAAFFYCGIWGAALSSALISLLAAPRTLQKLARDRIVPGVLGTGSKSDDTPRIATLLTFAIALVAIWLGGLNAIAKALSMFFLTTYGLLNFAAAMESLLDNPSWRPTFRVKWWISMTGAVGSFTVMFFLNAVAAAMAIAVGFAIYIWVYKRHLNRRWEDIRTGLWLFLTRTLLYRLRNYEPDLRNWRPNLLVFTGAPTHRWHLVQLAEALSQGRGILTLATMIPEKAPEAHAELLTQSLNDVFEKHGVTALTRVHRTDNLLQGMRQLIAYYGIGNLKPNTVLLGHSDDFRHRNDFADLIIHTCNEKRNLILARESPDERSEPAERRIDLWWNGQKQKLGFMLAVAYLMQHSRRWSDCSIQIHAVLPSDSEHELFEENVKNMLANDRIDVELLTWPSDKASELFTHIQRISADAEVIITSMRMPEPEETVESYAAYYGQLSDELPNPPLLIQVIPVEDLPFLNLFR